ncbi:MAG: hypothetical protein VX741_10585 [Pseudomonadota bacterium]|nr:hypothetical protein [Pseudomonadota bacterium]
MIGYSGIARQRAMWPILRNFVIALCLMAVGVVAIRDFTPLLGSSQAAKAPESSKKPLIQANSGPSLLGMSFLRRLQGYEVREGKLVLRW